MPPAFVTLTGREPPLDAQDMRAHSQRLSVVIACTCAHGAYIRVPGGPNAWIIDGTRQTASVSVGQVAGVDDAHLERQPNSRGYEGIEESANCCTRLLGSHIAFLRGATYRHSLGGDNTNGSIAIPYAADAPPSTAMY